MQRGNKKSTVTVILAPRVYSNKFIKTRTSYASANNEIRAFRHVKHKCSLHADRQTFLDADEQKLFKKELLK